MNEPLCLSSNQVVSCCSMHATAMLMGKVCERMLCWSSNWVVSRRPIHATKNAHGLRHARTYVLMSNATQRNIPGSPSTE